MSFSSKFVLFVVVCPCLFGDSGSDFLVVHLGSPFPCVEVLVDAYVGCSVIS